MHLTPDDLIDLAEGTRNDRATAHLQSCDVCRVEVLALKAAIASAAGVDVPDPAPMFWDQFSARVRGAVAAENRPARRHPRVPAWAPSWPAAALIGVAAAVVIALYVTAPRSWRPFASPPAAYETAAELVLQPFGAVDDPSLTLVAELTGQLDPDAVNEAGWSNHPGAVEEAVANLTDAERIELQRLLKEAIEKRDAS